MFQTLETVALNKRERPLPPGASIPQQADKAQDKQ